MVILQIISGLLRGSSSAPIHTIRLPIPVESTVSAWRKADIKTIAIGELRGTAAVRHAGALACSPLSPYIGLDRMRTKQDQSVSELG